MLDRYGARDDIRAREEALVRAYMGANFAQPSFLAGGGGLETGLTATGKALARLSGIPGLVSGAKWSVTHPIEAMTGQGRAANPRMELASFGKPGMRAFTEHMNEFALPVRAEAGRTGRAQAMTPEGIQSVPPIATSKEGVPLAAFPRPPQAEGYLGNDTLSLMLERVGVAKQPNANRLSQGMFQHGVDPGDLPLRRDLKEAMTEDLYSYGPDEVEEGLGMIQDLIDKAWSRQRSTQVMGYGQAMNKASELEQKGGDLASSSLPGLGQLGKRMLDTAARRRSQARQQAPYLIPPGLESLIRRPGGTRGGA